MFAEHWEIIEKNMSDSKTNPVHRQILSQMLTKQNYFGVCQWAYIASVSSCLINQSKVLYISLNKDKKEGKINKQKGKLNHYSRSGPSL